MNDDQVLPTPAQHEHQPSPWTYPQSDGVSSNTLPSFSSGDEGSPLLASHSKPINSSIHKALRFLPTLGREVPSLIDSAEQPTPDVHARFGLRSFLADISSIHSGTVPVSLLIATVIGILCGVSAYLYYALLEFLLQFFWRTLPETIATVTSVPPSVYWLWTPIVGMTFAVLVGASIVVMGFPGDLPYTVECVHKLGYVPLGHAPSMVVASQVSILGGGSLGPEAPLVAICASIAGWVSMTVFRQRYKNIVRKHTLCGMACALAAFFGVPLGGSLFALEVNNRLGYEYFEHAVMSIASGTICLVVFRSLAGLPIGPIYQFTAAPLSDTSGTGVMVGALIGAIGAGFASLFAHFHWAVVRWLRNRGWNDKPMYLSVFGGIGICTLAVLIPHTMFWGEFEMQTIGSLAPASTLQHIWPTSGLFNFEITGFFSAFLVGIAKLVAVSFTVAGGYRGGFIFPFFAAGAALGRAVWFLFPSIPPVIAMLSFAAGINVAITRTVISTPLILCALAGEINATSPVLAASLVSAFVTYYMVSPAFFDFFLIELSFNVQLIYLCVLTILLRFASSHGVAFHCYTTRAGRYVRVTATLLHVRRKFKRRRRRSGRNRM